MGHLIARAIVRTAAWLTPREGRRDFVREWDAELWHEMREGRASASKLCAQALGAWADARARGRIDRERREGRKMGEWMAGWGRDLRQAVRALARTPGFAFVAVLTLSLGIGGSAAIYTLLDRVVLDPLPYPEAERLVELTNLVPGVGPDAEWGMSTAQYVFLTERPSPFEAHALYRGFGAVIQTPEGPQRATGWRVTAGLLPLLGARPEHGRLIDRGDDRPGSTDVVVLSHAFWERQFGSDPGAVGRVLPIDGQPFEIIGILEPSVRLPGIPPELAGDLWLPMRIEPAGSFTNTHIFSMIARLSSGGTPSAAERAMERLRAELPARFPRAYTENFFQTSGFQTRVTPLKEAVVGKTAENLWILFGAVGLVLFIACANVANLFLVRMESRRREIEVRAALGASRGALARHLLAEGLVLALLGGVAALVVTSWGVPALVSLSPQSIPRMDSLVRVGAETLWFTLALSLVIGVGLALLPLLRYGRALRGGARLAGGRTVSVGRTRQRFRSALVVTQVALALTLIVGAGLLVESLQRLASIDMGLEPEGLVTGSLYLMPDRYASSVEMWTTYNQILERVRAVPGVSEAGLSAELPVEGGFGCTVQGFEDPTVYDHLSDIGLSTCAGQEPTSPGYFEATRIPVLQGRVFTDRDNDDPASGSVVVSKAFADRFWPGEDPLGKGVAPSGRSVPPFYHVIGVVADVPARSLDGDPAIAIYYPMVSHPDTPENWRGFQPSWMRIVVRTELADPLSIVPELRAAVRSVDPLIPLDDVRSMESIVRESVARFTFTSALLSLAAVVALLLAAVGLYGVVSYVVGQRSREIGMRMAIGARPGEVERLFVRRSGTLVALGLVVGTGLALLGSRVMEGLLYGVEATDPGAFAVAAALLAGIGLLASWIPARRAARIGPAEALRLD